MIGHCLQKSLPEERKARCSRGILYALAFLLCIAVFANVQSRRARQTVLLIASFALYFSWSYWFGAVLLASTVMNYLLGRSLRQKQSRLTLWLGIVLNLALLSTFKYLPEAALHLPFSSLQKFSHLALPLGISFWTFQAMSYLFDTYQGEGLDPSFFEFALYMVFFPVTISDPSAACPNASAISVRSRPCVEKHRPRPAAHRHGRVHDATCQTAGTGNSGGDGITSGFDRVLTWSGPGRLVPCFRLRPATLLRLRRILPHRHWRSEVLSFTIPENFARPV